jgi:hypothetical protein
MNTQHNAPVDTVQRKQQMMPLGNHTLPPGNTFFFSPRKKCAYSLHFAIHRNSGTVSAELGLG